MSQGVAYRDDESVFVNSRLFHLGLYLRVAFFGMGTEHASRSNVNKAVTGGGSQAINRRTWTQGDKENHGGTNSIICSLSDLDPRYHIYRRHGEGCGQVYRTSRLKSD